MTDRYNNVSKKINDLKNMIFDIYRDVSVDEKKEIRTHLLNIDTILYLKDIDDVERHLG